MNNKIIFHTNPQCCRRRLSILFICFLIVSFFLAIAGCRDEVTNTQTTNPPSPDSLLFSKDSIYSGPLGNNSEVTYRILDTNITKIKVSFTLKTDDITDTATTSSLLIIADSIFSVQKYGFNNNGDFNFTFNIKSTNTGYANVKYNVTRNINSPYYIVMRNIKLYKTN